MRRLHIAAAALLIALAARAGAQVTTAVPPDHAAYEDLRRLVEAGAVAHPIAGIRPLSRREMARLARDGRIRARRAGAPALPIAAAEALGRLEAAFSEEIRLLDGAPAPRAGFRHSLRAEAAWMDSPYRVIEDVGLGAVDAWVNPLAGNRSGRPLADGATLAIEPGLGARVGNHLALSASPRLELLGTRGNVVDGGLSLHTAYAVTGARNVRLLAGRGHLILGQGELGGLALSQHGPALDLLRLYSEAPFTLPWQLRRLGPMRATLWVADLGADRDFPHSRLAGYKVSLASRPWLELGTTVMVQTGGQGAPPGTFLQRVADLVPLLDVIFLPDSDLQFSDKLAGVDARVRVAALRGLQLWADLLLDDFDARRLRSSLWEDAGLQLGAQLPGLGRSGRASAAVEYHHTGLRYYEHGQFTSGIARSGFLLGDPLGPRGDAGYLRLRHGGRFLDVSATAAVERRSGDGYSIEFFGPREEGFRFIRVLDLPEERRARAELRLDRLLGASTRAVAAAGVERVRNFGFVSRSSRTGVMASVALVYSPSR